MRRAACSSSGSTRKARITSRCSPHDKQLVLFCAAGWRSALATKTLQDMGLAQVAHIDGGFSAWKAAGAPVAEKAKK